MKYETRELATSVYILSAIAIIIALFFLIAGLSEYYNVAIQGQESAYTFGMGYQWYYESATVYSLYNLFSGLFFGISLIFIIMGIIKKKRKIVFIGIGSTLSLFIIERISSIIYV